MSNAERETTNSGMTNFGSKKNKDKARQNQKNIQKNLDDNKQRSENAKKQPKNTKKIETLIEEGKQLVQLHFQGYSEVERANIKADLDDTLPHRLSEPYYPVIERHALENYEKNHEQREQILAQTFLGGVSISTALKLYASATDSEKLRNHGLTALNTKKVKLPKRLATIIDALGKTDLPGENHFRLNNQDFAAKRHLVRGSCAILGSDVISQVLRTDRELENISFDQLMLYLEDEEFFPNMIDDSLASVERLHQIGKQTYEKAAEENITFKISESEEYAFRLPKFQIGDTLDPETFGKILKNEFIVRMKDSSPDIVRALSGLVCMIAQPQWLRNPSKTLGSLANYFKNTYFETVTFENILKNCKVWNINDFLTTTDLNEIAIQAIHKWNSADSKILGEFLDMVEITFAEFGNEAQLIQVDQANIDRKSQSKWKWKNFKIMGRPVSRSPLKASPDSTLLGIFSGLTKNIEFKSDFEAKHNKTNHELLYLYLRKDMNN